MASRNIEVNLALEQDAVDRASGGVCHAKLEIDVRSSPKSKRFGSLNIEVQIRCAHKASLGISLLQHFEKFSDLLPDHQTAGKSLPIHSNNAD